MNHRAVNPRDPKKPMHKGDVKECEDCSPWLVDLEAAKAEIAALRETMRNARCPRCWGREPFPGAFVSKADCDKCGGVGTLEAYHDIKHGSVKK